MNKNKLLIIIGSIIAAIAIIFIVLSTNNKQEITYNVFFNTDGGTPIDTQVVNKGQQVTKPVDPIKDGYTFIEWTYEGETYDFTHEVTSDLTLTAKWIKLEDDVETFIVKFESNGGTTISNQIVAKGNKIEKPVNPTKDGYTFVGWTLKDEIYNFDNIVEENIELKAKWEKVKDTTTTNTSNKKTTTTTTTTKPATTTTTTTTTKPTPTPEEKYTVTFNSNGGSSVSSQTVVKGSKAIQPSNPTRTGYNFVGWMLNGNTYNFASAVTSDITLIAKWTQKNYTITATKVDAYSPDSVLTVYEEGKKITVKSIKYSDGTYLCSGTNTTVNTSDIAGETTFIVILNDGTQVTATIK